MADHPEFKEKINLSVLLAPIGSVRSITVSILQLLKSAPFFTLARALGIH
jgi:hypothetical protein